MLACNCIRISLIEFKVMESKNLIYLVTEYAANGELLGSIIALHFSCYSSIWIHLYFKSRSTYSRKTSNRSESERKISSTCTCRRIYSFETYRTYFRLYSTWIHIRFVFYVHLHRFIVSRINTCSIRKWTDLLIGDLKAENLLLDSHGNIKVAGMKKHRSFDRDTIIS
jgi:serine/threonine protein kinase